MHQCCICFTLDPNSGELPQGATGATNQLPSINQGQSNSYPNSTNGNGRQHVHQAYNIAGVSPPQFNNQPRATSGTNRATSAGIHGRVDWKAKYLK